MGFLKWLWHDLVKTLKDERGIWPLVIGAGALSGGAAGLWAKSQAEKNKPQEYRGRGVSDNINQVYGNQPTETAINALMGPEATANLYEREAFQPGRQQALYEHQRTTMPGLNEQISQSGLGGTSYAMRQRSLAAQALSNQLSGLRANTRMSGLGVGTENARQRAQLRLKHLGMSQAQEGAAAEQDMNIHKLRIPQEQRYRDLQRATVPTGLDVFGKILQMPGGMSSLKTLGNTQTGRGFVEQNQPYWKTG